jgi:hypothetical protein
MTSALNDITLLAPVQLVSVAITNKHASDRKATRVFLKNKSADLFGFTAERRPMKALEGTEPNLVAVR